MKTFTTHQMVELLRNNVIFKGADAAEKYSDEALEEVIRIIKISELKAGDIVFKQGNQGDSIVLLLRGEVAVYVSGGNGIEIHIAIIEENNFFGEMAIIDDTDRMASVRAASDCLLGTISIDDFWEYFYKHPMLAKNVLRGINQRLRDTDASYIERLAKEKEELIRFNRELERKVKEKAESLERSQKQLIQSEKMASLGQLVAGVAHEINTPVGIGVTVSSHLTQSTKKIISSFENNKMSKSDLTKYFSSTLKTSELILQHLLQTADLIQSFKMVSADQTSHERRIFNVKSYLEDIILSLKPKLKNKPHQITIACDDDIEIDSYPGALAQIITNMVLNSLIHAFNEGDNGTIAIEVLKNANGIILKYRDDGKGIPEENIKNIFEPFFTTKRGEGGTGLGMHIVYNTVTQILKGSISCESIQGKGISFFINLPAKLEN